MAVCTLVKLEAYRERGSHMRRVATATKGGSEALWAGRAVGHPQRMSSATAGFFFFHPFKNTIVYTESTGSLFVSDNSVKKI